MRLLVPGFSLNVPNSRLIDLAEYYELPLVMLNSLLIQSIREQTYLGDRARLCLESGKLIPDSLILQLLEERLTEADVRHGWILSGFPRTIHQASVLNAMLLNIEQPYDRVIHFEGIPRTQPLSSSDDQLNYPDYLPNNNILNVPLASFYNRLNLLTTLNSEMSLAEIDNILWSSVREPAKAFPQKRDTSHRL